MPKCDICKTILDRCCPVSQKQSMVAILCNENHEYRKVKMCKACQKSLSVNKVWNSDINQSVYEIKH